MFSIKLNTNSSIPIDTIKNTNSFIDQFKNRSTATPIEKSFNGFFNKSLEKLLAQIQLYEYTDKKIIEKFIEKNPQIANILNKANIKLEINISNLETLTNSHLNPTLEIANAIVDILKSEYKFTNVQRKAIIKGAIFHDFGKVLIPGYIINKKGKLTDSERKIVELHSELGYQLLKSANLDEESLHVIRHHHKYNDGSGYPANSNEPNITAQIVTVADIFTALVAKRSYKSTMSPLDALKVIEEKVKAGKIDKKIFNALKKYLESTIKNF